MKRIHILLLLLVLVGVGAWWVISNEPVQMPDIDTTIPGTGTVIVPSDTAAMTGSDTATGSVQTGKVDDTELPLDQSTGTTATDPAVTDPEVEEIIGLLEELIEESEK